MVLAAPSMGPNPVPRLGMVAHRADRTQALKSACRVSVASEPTPRHAACAMAALLRAALVVPDAAGGTVLGAGVAHEVLLGRRSESPSGQPNRAGFEILAAVA